MENHFSLFALPERFAIDMNALERAYKNIQTKVHPDRFAAASAAERRVAMQWAARVNEAYGVLRSPLKRAAYLCELRAAPVDSQTNTAMPREFMLQHMQWREALDAARHPLDIQKVISLRGQLTEQQAAVQAQVAAAIDERGDMLQAAAGVRQWMFLERFDHDVQQVLHGAQDASATQLKLA